MFNKSEIMKAAWEMVRNADTAKYGLRRILRRCLRRAWSDAKYAIAAAKRAALATLLRTEVDNIREAILVLDCKDRWTQTNYARHDALYQQLRAA